MRRWFITLLVVAVIPLLGFATWRWSVVLLAFLDLNGGRVQTTADLFQLLIWGSLASWFVIKQWRPSKSDSSPIPPTPPTHNNPPEGGRNVTIGDDAEDVTVNTGDHIEGDLVERDKVTNIFLLSTPVLEEERDEGTDLAGQIRLACLRATNRLAGILRDGRPIITRKALRHKLNQFLDSSLRYSFALGGSGVGKSTFIGFEAQRLLKDGWAVLLVRGSNFTLNNLADAVRQEFEGTPPAMTWQQIINTLHAGAGNGPGFALLIDALDNGDPNVITREFALLHDSLGDTDPRLFKVIASCKDIDWARLLQHPQMPSYEEEEDFNCRIGLGYFPLHVKDFTSDELNDALRLIGGTELLTSGRFGERVNPHVATVRDLIKHPAMFEHYAELHLSGDPASVSNLTWGGLIEQRLRRGLGQAARQCGMSSDELRVRMTALAVHSRERNSRESLIESEDVRGALPDLFTLRPNSTRTPFDALVGYGILVEQPSLDGRTLIGFRITDAVGYLLSFELERQSANANDEEFRDLVEGWLEEALNYAPVLDALLELADRLGENPREPRLLLLLGTLLEEHRSYSDLFRLMRPTVIVSIFELITRDDSEYIHTYKEAARQVRASEEMLTEVRLRLQDPDSRIRELAAELAGVHRDVSSTSNLRQLLEDQEEDVGRAAWIALGRIGRPALTSLLEIASDVSQPAESRSHCVAVLRVIGFRDAGVSAAVARCLLDAEDTDDARLMRNALLTAAHLRDPGHAAHAIRALTHEDDDVAQAAAKLLTEAPAPAAFDALRQAIHPQLTPSGELRKRYWLPRQLIAALVASDAERAQPVILELIREGLAGRGELREVGALEAVERTGLPPAYALALEDLADRLDSQPNQTIVWRSAELLGKTWRTDQLDAMIEAARNLSARGLNIARLIVDAVAPNMREHDEYPMGKRLNRVVDLRPAIKCQAANFIADASPLLAEARALSTTELCELFWVAGDVSAEQWLLQKLDNPASSPGRVRLEKQYLMRALGTCGTERGVTAVLNYARLGQEISIYFPQETLFPLLRRQVLSAEALADLVRDPTASVNGRALCLIALGVWDVRAHQDLFAQIAREAEVEVLQRHAVRMLGFGEDASLIPYLRGLLRNSPHNSVKVEAAEALARLDARQAIHDMERALEDTHSSGYLKPLVIFREESSLQVVLNTLRDARPEFLGLHLEALAAFSHQPQGAAAVRERFDEWATGEPNPWDTQAPLVRGLVTYNPALLLERVNSLYDEGLLDTSARTTLAGRIPRLFQSEAADRTLLRDLVTRLICDRDAQTRDITVHSLRKTSEQFCSEVYEALNSSPESDEWSRACAVHALGLWNSEREATLIESLRHDSELLIRRAADSVIESIRRHRNLQAHLENFNGTEGLSRLSAYLCLKQQGTPSTIRSLHDDPPDRALTRTFVRHLTDGINKRLKEVYRKRQDEDQKIDESRGTIWFS